MGNRITVVHVGNVNSYPPVISLLENLIELGCSINLVSGTKQQDLVDRIANATNVSFTYIAENNEHTIIKKIERNSIYKREYQAAVANLMKKADILWTTTDVTVKVLGKTVLQYKHVMQLMELIEYIPQFADFQWWRFPIDEYARKAWKVVVPQVDRAYIQKTWWKLEKTPVVLPNKPYSLDYGNPTSEMIEKYNIMMNDNKKKVLYLGVIGSDRNLDRFAEAMQGNREYALYLIGRAAYGNETYLEQLLKDYPDINYLGFFNPPKHLFFLKDIHIGLLPYVAQASLHYSTLNAQYCAPNKIYEYAGYGIPMIGTDVLGIKRPLEEYKMGVTLSSITCKTVIDAIRMIDADYATYSNNCKNFSSAVDLRASLKNILEI